MNEREHQEVSMLDTRESESESGIQAGPLSCDDLQSQIPQNEFQHLALSLADARDWAERGNTTLGYTALLRGLLHAERHVLSGCPWAPALVKCWRQVIDGYCRVYGRDTLDD